MMAIVLPCECGKQLRVSEELAGKKVRCPICQAILAVPANGADTPQPRAVPAAPSPPDTPRPAPSVRASPQPVPRAGGGPPIDRPSPPRQLALRIVVLVLGIVGSLAAALLALGAYTSANDPSEQAASAFAQIMIKDLEKANPNSPELQELRSAVARHERMSLLGHVAMAACVLGIMAALLAFFRLGKVAAPLMILPAVAAAVLVAKSLIFTALLIVTGILCLFIKPRPRAEAAT
jgi:hypothetical protein